MRASRMTLEGRGALMPGGQNCCGEQSRQLVDPAISAYVLSGQGRQFSLLRPTEKGEASEDDKKMPTNMVPLGKEYVPRGQKAHAAVPNRHE